MALMRCVLRTSPCPRSTLSNYERVILLKMTLLKMLCSMSSILIPLSLSQEQVCPDQEIENGSRFPWWIRHFLVCSNPTPMYLYLIRKLYGSFPTMYISVFVTYHCFYMFTWYLFQYQVCFSRR